MGFPNDPTDSVNAYIICCGHKCSLDSGRSIRRISLMSDDQGVIIIGGSIEPERGILEYCTSAITDLVIQGLRRVTYCSAGALMDIIKGPLNGIDLVVYIGELVI